MDGCFVTRPEKKRLFFPNSSSSSSSSNEGQFINKTRTPNDRQSAVSAGNKMRGMKIQKAARAPLGYDTVDEKS